MRTHSCGELTSKNLRQTVTLCGWVHGRRDHGGLTFIDLRDRYGMTQIVFEGQVAEKLRAEFVIRVTGNVRARPEGMKNSKLPTGDVEVLAKNLEVLSEAKVPPFEIDDTKEVAENLRLKYRYLDLRRPSLQRCLLRRHELISSAREFLNSQQFVEVETPILYKSTPEGARDFIVPSRLNPGTFYALPQSPQTLKQLLMVAGMDRYYQIARCFRDEDLRADRQPEFSQIDIEASFMNEETLFGLMEHMLQKMWKTVLDVEIPIPFQRMKYEDAMARYGSDKPDLRFGLEIQDITTVFSKTQFQVLRSARCIRAICIQGAAEKFSRKDIDELQAQATLYGAKGLLWIKIQESDIQSPAAKHLAAEEIASLRKQLSLKAGDLVLIVADVKDKIVSDSLGSVRLALGKKLDLIPKAPVWKFLWVTHFPLLQYDEREQRYFACHHPFTSPAPGDVEDFVSGKNLDSIKASAYDVVLNGMEIGGGSLRIFNSKIQDAMFRNLGITPEEAKEKFGFFLEALQYGTPPHGGIAFGVDRLAALLSGVDAIRDVMAFPKTQRGHCLMSESPSSVAPNQLIELGISLKK